MQNLRAVIIFAAFGAIAMGAQAFPFGKPKAEKAAEKPATQQTAPAPASLLAPKEQRDQALRAEPLTQAAFFAAEFEKDPTDYEAALYLSNALRTLGRFKEAADAAHRALLLQPDNYDLLLAAGRAHIAGEDAFYAIEPLKRAVELKPNAWQPHSLLGVAYDQVKRPNDATSEWELALKLSPNNPQVLTNIAMSKAASGDLAGAESLLRIAVAQKGADVQVRQNLALVLGLQGKFDEAETLLRQDLPPELADANLAWLKARQADASAPTGRTWESVR